MNRQLKCQLRSALQNSRVFPTGRHISKAKTIEIKTFECSHSNPGNPRDANPFTPWEAPEGD